MDPINIGKLNKLNPLKGKNKIDSFEERINLGLQRLKERAEREVCEYGPFKTVKETMSQLNPKNSLKELSIQITPLPNSLKNQVENFDKLRYLELIGEGQMGQKESIILKRGTKEEILTKIKEEDFYNQVLKKADEFKISFLED